MNITGTELHEKTTVLFRQRRQPAAVKPGDGRRLLEKPGFRRILVMVMAALAVAALLVMPRMNRLQEMEGALPVAQSTRQVIFQQDTRYVPNPFMGAVAPAKYRTRYVEGTLVVAGYTWREIEAEKGNIDFSEVEEQNNFRYWIEEHQNQYMLMLVMDYPTLSREITEAHIDIPLWMYEALKEEAAADYSRRLEEARRLGNQEDVREAERALQLIRNDRQVIRQFNATFADTADIPGVGTFYRWKMDLPDGGVEYRGGFSPNYASPLLMAYHHQALEAVAERYDNDKTYAIVMGSLGHWGEMHTHFIQQAGAAGRYPVKEIASQYEEKYAEVFQQTLVSVRYPRQVVLDHHFGLHNHAFGSAVDTYQYHQNWYENGYVDHYTGDTHPAMPDFWKTAPSGGEFLYTGDQRFLTNAYIDATIQMARDTHLTWLNEAFFYMDNETRVNQEKLFSHIGYRFMIRQAAHSDRVTAGNTLTVQSTWSNEGTAPFYEDWPIVLRLQTPAGETVAEAVVSERVRTLFPQMVETHETRLEVPEDLTPGTYGLWVGIVNPETGEAPVRLTVKEVPQRNNLVYVGEVTVTRRSALAEMFKMLN
ncbi:DUF4832 domain-containing protein [Anoxynatronum buryatiense]|uniref:DUF4832 domain-containing protein n=1 Tax=Anoxynatronum buryatiense TaxID=489973 RepID=A0AA46AIZ9_9CLOT|nr:DUF4832 domain-containing protein [Anoxynatronum buryatiense]SMP54848.1 protein of unknown function [Anoxynatronum buryatiense]